MESKLGENSTTIIILIIGVLIGFAIRTATAPSLTEEFSNTSPRFMSCSSDGTGCSVVTDHDDFYVDCPDGKFCTMYTRTSGGI